MELTGFFKLENSETYVAILKGENNEVKHYHCPSAGPQWEQMYKSNNEPDRNVLLSWISQDVGIEVVYPQWVIESNISPMTFAVDGRLSLPQYGYGSNTGGAMYLLGVDMNGNVIEVPTTVNIGS